MLQYLSLPQLRFFIVTNRDRYLFEKKYLRTSVEKVIYNHPQYIDWINNDDFNFSFNYSTIKSFLEFYPLRISCLRKINKLLYILEHDKKQLVKWVKDTKEFYDEEVFYFDISYFNWIDYESSEFIKINKYIYTDRQPFEQIYFFNKIFGFLLWEVGIDKLPDNSPIPIEIDNEITKSVAKYFG